LLFASRAFQATNINKHSHRCSLFDFLFLHGDHRLVPEVHDRWDSQQGAPSKHAADRQDKKASAPLAQSVLLLLYCRYPANET